MLKNNIFFKIYIIRLSCSLSVWCLNSLKMVLSLASNQSFNPGQITSYIGQIQTLACKQKQTVDCEYGVSIRVAPGLSP
jgi:hypothetical protein